MFLIKRLKFLPRVGSTELCLIVVFSDKIYHKNYYIFLFTFYLFIICNFIYLFMQIYKCTSTYIHTESWILEGRQSNELYSMVHPIQNIYLSIILFCSTHTLEYPAFQKSQMSVCCQLYTKTTLLLSIPSNLLISSGGINFVTPTANFCLPLLGSLHKISKNFKNKLSFKYFYLLMFFMPKSGSYKVF
jgi:hypothetical protein